jgi:NAD+ dependent glucose-6-phosphate dehydrogenase
MKSIEVEKIETQHGIPFQIFYGISDNTRKFWSIFTHPEGNWLCIR